MVNVENRIAHIITIKKKDASVCSLVSLNYNQETEVLFKVKSANIKNISCPLFSKILSGLKLFNITQFTNLLMQNRRFMVVVR